MSDNGTGDFIPQPFGFGSDYTNILKDLTGFDDKKIGDKDNKTTLRKSFATLSNFLNSEQADAWVDLMMLAYETKRWDEWDYLVLWAESRVSIEGTGRQDVLKGLAGLYYIREQQKEKGDDVGGRKTARSPGRQFV